MSRSIAFEVHLNTTYDAALEQVTAALKTEGFGILTKIDVRTTMKEKLDEEFRPFAILGACNPPLAHRALSHDARAGLLLPCNVTVEADPRGASWCAWAIRRSCSPSEGWMATRSCRGSRGKRDRSSNAWRKRSGAPPAEAPHRPGAVARPSGAGVVRRRRRAPGLESVCRGDGVVIG